LKCFDEDYRHLKVTAPLQRQPDVLVRLAESLRHKAGTAGSAPCLTGPAAQSLTGQQHFSAGNAWDFGFFSLRYGLDSIFVSHAMRKLPAAMPQVMQQAGYFRAFPGSGELDMNLNDTVVQERVFDCFSSQSPGLRTRRWRLSQTLKTGWIAVFVSIPGRLLNGHCPI